MLFGCCLALRAGLSALLLETMHFIPETLVGLLLQRRHGLFMLAFPRGYLLDLGAQGCKLSAEFFVFLGCCLGMLARLGEFLVNLTDLVLKTLALPSLPKRQRVSLAGLRFGQILLKFMDLATQALHFGLRFLESLIGGAVFRSADGQLVADLLEFLLQRGDALPGNG